MLQLPLAASKNSSIAIGYFLNLVLQLKTCCVQFGPFLGVLKQIVSFLGLVTIVLGENVGIVVEGEFLDPSISNLVLKIST
jgi:hypothetical protein